MNYGLFNYRKNRVRNYYDSPLNELLRYIEVFHISSSKYKELSEYDPRYHSSIHYSVLRTERKNDFYRDAKKKRQTAAEKLIGLIDSARSIEDLASIINRVFDFEISQKKRLLTYRMSSLKWEDRNLCCANDPCCGPLTFLVCLPKNCLPSIGYRYKNKKVSRLWKKIIDIANKRTAVLAKDLDINQVLDNEESRAFIKNTIGFKKFQKLCKNKSDADDKEPLLAKSRVGIFSRASSPTPSVPPKLPKYSEIESCSEFSFSP